jgi:hypothetical protein
VVSSRLLERGKAELYVRESRRIQEYDVEKIPGIVRGYIENEGLDGIETEP